VSDTGTTPTHIITLNYVIFQIIRGVGVSVSVVSVFVFVLHSLTDAKEMIQFHIIQEASNFPNYKLQGKQKTIQKTLLFSFSLKE